MSKEVIAIKNTGDEVYAKWLCNLKQNIGHTRIKASIAVNEEMLRLYWRIGSDIVQMQFENRYGSNFFARLSRDLKQEFPDSQGFSVTNLKYMKRFYQFYKPIRHQLGDEFKTAPATQNSNLTPLDQSDIFDILFTIPWRHHIEILTKAKSLDEAIFFIYKVREHNWSRATLLNMMDTKLYQNRGQTINNFALTLPKDDSDLAREILHDNYKLDFLALAVDYQEKDLQRALETNLTQFLLTLGSGFAYVGRQVSFVVDGDEYLCDLLFYHLRLRCYVVVELKVVKFQPEFVSKLNFYCHAVDHLIKDKQDKQTIGLLICKEKNDVVAQWTVESSTQPIGVSTYSLQNILPSEGEIISYVRGRLAAKTNSSP